MRQIVSSACAALALIAPTVAYSAPVQDGIYQVFNYNPTDADPRGVWSNNLVQGPSNLLWGVDGIFTVSNNGADALLQGTATSLNDASLQFLFEITMTVNNGANDGYCQFSSWDPECDDAGHLTSIANGEFDPADWAYFDIDAQNSSFTGINGMQGLSYNISDTSGGRHRAQVGESANALDINGENGLSFWFDFEQVGALSAPNPNQYVFNTTGNGDFNLNLSNEPDPEAQVPLPAAGWMLLAGLGGLAAARRRRKAA